MDVSMDQSSHRKWMTYLSSQSRVSSLNSCLDGMSVLSFVRQTRVETYPWKLVAVIDFEPYSSWRSSVYL
jgi:hypothetical protein